MTTIGRFGPDGVITIGELVEFPPELRGGRNLARGTNTEKWMAFGSSTVTISNHEESVVVQSAWNGSTATWGIAQSAPYRDKMVLPAGEEYVLSFLVRGTVGLPLNYVYVMNNGVPNENVGVRTIESETEFRRLEYRFTKRQASTSSYLMISNQNGNIPGAWFEVKGVKVEKGKVATPWTPTPEDLGLSYPDWVQSFGSFGPDGITAETFIESDDLPANVPVRLGRNITVKGELKEGGI